MISILIADDHPLFREALSGALRPVFPKLSIFEAGDLGEALEKLRDNPTIGLVLLDLNMPGGEHFNALIAIQDEFPDLPVVVISANDTADVMIKAISLGAKGYITKTSTTREIAQAIETVEGGGEWIPDEVKDKLHEVGEGFEQLVARFKELTPKQVQVLNYVKSGMMNKQIAYEMNVTEATIKAHISAVLKKLGINTRTQAVLLMEKLDTNDI